MHTKSCDCSCGEVFFRYTKGGAIRKFVNQAHRNKVMNENMRQRTLDDPEYAERISQVRSQAAKKMYKDRPDMIRIRRQQMTKRYEDPEEREKTSQKAKEYWESEEHREEQRQRQLKFIEENPRISELRGEASKEYWTDEENRKKRSEYLLEKFKDPSKHPRWEGGISNDPYDEEWNSKFRSYIRTRQNHICADEDTTCSDNGKELAVHHIDRDKQNSVPENCIALCNSHHVRAHTSEAQIRHKALIAFLT